MCADKSKASINLKCREDLVILFKRRSSVYPFLGTELDLLILSSKIESKICFWISSVIVNPLCPVECGTFRRFLYILCFYLVKIAFI